MPEQMDDGADAGTELAKLVEAFSNKHGQVDVNLKRLSLRLPGTQIGVDVSGALTLTIHMRELTENEKQSSAAGNIALMSKAG
jgi:hypothetical protein